MSSSLTDRLGAWRHPRDEPGARGRDLRVDVLRGLAICLVVVNHIEVPSLYHLATQEALGPWSGAEVFVLLSGAVVAMAYRARAERGVRAEVLLPLWSRARKLYLTTLAVAVLAWLAGLVPGVDARVVTTWTQQVDGVPVVHDLYGGVAGGMSWPPPANLLGDLLLLRLGPWQFNIMGLYVVLLLAAPVLLGLLRHHRTALLLGGSVLLYVAHRLSPLPVTPSVFESSFPLLAWQLLFVLGMVGGWHRSSLLAAARTAAGRGAVGFCALVVAAATFFSWNSPWRPWVPNPYARHLDVIPEDRLNEIYRTWFERTPLDPGRILVVLAVVVTLYALLTLVWGAVSRVLVPTLGALGQATLYVFVVHVALVLALANVPALDGGSVPAGTLAHTVALAVVLLMVRRRVLFRLIPR